MLFYQLYGLTIGANCPLVNLASLVIANPNPDDVDIWIELSEKSSSWFFDDCPYDVNEEGVCVRKESHSDGHYTRIVFNKDDTRAYTEFVISPSGDRIWGTWVDTLVEDAVTLMLGLVMGCILRLRGLLCLHGSVIKVNDYAITILGHKGMGKSTTAAALAQRGYPILSDDIAVLTSIDGDVKKGFWVQAGYPNIRLWPSSLEALESSDLNSLPVLSIGEKRYLELGCDNSRSSETNSWQFQTKPLPLKGIYILDQRKPDLKESSISAVISAQGLINLIPHRSAGSLLPLDNKQKTQEFKLLSQLVTNVALRKIERPDNLQSLPQLCDAIVADACSIDLS